LLRNATAQDAIVTYDKDVLTRHLRYYGKATVLNLYKTLQQDSDIGLLHAQLAGTSGRIYVLDDVVEPPAFIRVAAPACTQRVTAFLEEQHWELRPVTSDRLGTIYAAK
jgi:hypothetical protein